MRVKEHVRLEMKEEYDNSSIERRIFDAGIVDIVPSEPERLIGQRCYSTSVSALVNAF